MVESPAQARRPRGLAAQVKAAGIVLFDAFKSALNDGFDLIEELFHHRFFQSLRELDWSAYQVGPILIASVLINLLEMASPLYINIVYTSVLPSGSNSSLIVLSVAVVLLMLLGGWLKTVRLTLTGGDGARMEHQRRMHALSHFLQIRLSSYLKASPARHLDRLASINLLRDESALQSLTTAIDLVFSLLFVLVLFFIADSVGVVAVLAILAYLMRALAFSREFESLSKARDRLELDRTAYQGKLMSSIELIKSNGLGRQFLVGNEERQEQLAWQRVINSDFSGHNQAFSALMSQLTYAGIATWGALLVIEDRLLLGALAAALLLAGKILTPWQQALGLWSSYRRLSHAREEYDALMETPLEPEGGHLTLDLTQGQDFKLQSGEDLSIAMPAGSVVLLRDDQFGARVRELFMQIIQVEPSSELHLNNLPVSFYQRDALRSSIAYVDPSRDFFEGTLLENITSFQPRRYQRRALFWAFLSRLDSTVRALPNGYSTSMGTTVPSGLSRDSQQLFHLVSALARSPRVLLLDLSDCSYGKEFIDGLERILRRTRGQITVLVSGAGRVLNNLSDQQIDLPGAAQEVMA